MRGIDYIANQEDIESLSNYLHTIADSIYLPDGTRVAPGDLLSWQGWAILPSGASPKYAFYNGRKVIDEKTDCVWVDHPRSSIYVDYLPGSIACSQDAPEAFALYKKIKAHVRSTFHLMSSKVYYIGPSLYDQWRKKEVSFHFFVDGIEAKFTISEKMFYETLDKLKASGYSVSEDEKALNTPMSDPQRDKRVVVFAAGANMPYDVRADHLFFRPEAEGVFLSLTKAKKNNCHVITDSRHAYSDGCNAVLDIYRAICDCLYQSNIAPNE